MSEASIGEIRTFAGNYIPEDQPAWLPCNGQSLAVSQYQELYSLIGTTYGGNGSTTFALPNLNGALPIGQGTSTENLTYAIGSGGGSVTVVLTEAECPQHTHTLYASSTQANTNTPSPQVGFAAVPGTDLLYVDTAKPIQPAPVLFSAQSVSPVGAGTAHANMMPSTAITYMIATQGYYPEFQ